MEKQSLYIYKLDAQGNKVKFPNDTYPAKLGEYTYTAQRMAGTPTLTATLNYPTCLDEEWSGEEFIEFRGERYYVGQVPTSSKDNKSIMYKHELQFVSERIVLENVYFLDVVTAGADTYHSNSTAVKFMGDINEFVGRLNASMAKSGIGYSVVIDEDITSESKLVSLDNVYLAEALQSIYTIYDLPYYFVGKVCHIGYTENVISTPFEYRKGLISVKKTNANYKIVNRVTGVGSSDNIPFYYPNDDATGTIERSQNLMPSIYRETGGAERFYNALNNTYKIPGANDYYTFKNLYSKQKVKEIKVDFSDIKPTIEGVTNASGQLFGEIADVAFDQNDSDELGTGSGNNVFNETDEYVHSYFYIKLHVYNGTYGFNLFEQGLEGGTAVINMTTGNCAACEFEIGVTYKDSEPNRAFNPVLVDSNGNLPAGDFEQKVTSQTSQYVERQQNTSVNEVWIAVKKDNTSFGVVMPNATKNYRPSIGDKFVITGIKMPREYVIAAEDKLEEALIKYMSENNDEKFTFSVNFSRVFLADNSHLSDILNENARMYIRYNDKEYLMYVSSYTCKADKNCLYDISVELTDKLSANVSALRSTISEIAGDIVGSSLGNANNQTDWIARASRIFLSKIHPDRAKKKITFEEGIGIGLEENGSIDAQGNADLLSLVVRELLRSPQFVDGFNGEGWKLWMEDSLSHLTIDKLTVRRLMVVFEQLIEKIRSVGGQLCVSAANGKIKEVESEGGYYFITFEQENTFVAHDLLRCQTFTKGAMKNYWVEVVASTASGIMVAEEEFEGTPPEAGDECVLMGNTSNPLRQNLILISATEDGQPRMDVMDGVKGKDFADCLRVRLGNLDGINSTMFPYDNQPHGNGLFADNVWLRGTFLLSNGEDVSTRFAIMDGKIESSVTALRNDLISDKSCLNNPAFSDGIYKWDTANDTVFFLLGNRWIWANGSILSKQGSGATVISDGGRRVVRIHGGYILQTNGNLRSIPKMPENGNGEKEAQPMYLTFFYRCTEAGTLNVKFENVDKTGFAAFNSMDVTEELAATEGYVQYSCDGLWNGTGDFRLSFTGDIRLYMLVLSTDKVEALAYRYKTLFEQSERLVKISAAVFDKDENCLQETGLMVKPEGSGIYMQGADGKLALIGVGVEENGKTVIKLTGDNIRLEGAVTANGNVFINEDGTMKAVNIVAENGTFTGKVTSDRGNIGSFEISPSSLVSKDGDNSMFLSAERVYFENSYSRASIGAEVSPGSAGEMQYPVYVSNEYDGGVFSVSNIGMRISVSGSKIIDDIDPYRGNHAFLIDKGDIAGFRLRTRRVSSSLTLSTMDSIIVAISTGITISLPYDSTVEDGQMYFIRNHTSGTVNVSSRLSNMGNANIAVKSININAGDLAVFIYDKENNVYTANYMGRWF